MITTFWKDPYKANETDLSGDLPTARGTDPNIDLSGSGAVKGFWGEAPVSTPGGEETANSVSGLPPAPQRYQPTVPDPTFPTLKDRQPGTIDKP